jgi:membrane protease YdiL (CAAX protease family)
MIRHALSSAVSQVILFSLIPFIWWLITARKKENFFRWLGLKSPDFEEKKKFGLFFLLTFLLMSISGLGISTLFAGNDSIATSQFSGLGLSGLIPVILFAFVQTGLSEEILFRGFIGKRAGNAWGFKAGNALQASLFGLLHGVLLAPSAGIGPAIIATVFSGTVGALMGYMNEKLAKGSIVPSWILHALANVLSSGLMLFSVH